MATTNYTILNKEEITAQYRRNYPIGSSNDSQAASSAFFGGARWAERVVTEKLVENAARSIYDGWQDHPGWVPWVLAGNSHKQDEARQLARKTLLVKE